MKLNKELIKQGVKNQFITILHMIIFNIISFVTLEATYIGTKPTGNIVISKGGLLGMTEYKVNLFFAIFFLILFLFLFTIFYTKFFKKDLKKQMKNHWSFILLFFLISVIFCLVEFAIIVITSFIATGMFGVATNYPNNVCIGVLLCIVGYIVIDSIKELIQKNN